MNLIGTLILLCSFIFPSLSSIAEAAMIGGDLQWEASDSRYKPGNYGASQYGDIVVRKGTQSYHAYCYNAFVKGPADYGEYPSTTEYARYGFYNGMNNLSSARGDEKQIDTAASVLVAGYPNDVLGLKEKYGQSSMEAAKVAITQKGYSVPWHDVNNFVHDATQIVLWATDEKTIPNTKDTENFAGKKTYDVITTHTPYKEIFNTQYAQTLYQYAKEHPLDIQTAQARNIKVVDKNGQEVNDNHPLVMLNNGKSEIFKIKDYGGIITLPSKMNNIRIYDASTNRPVDSLCEGKTYYAKGSIQQKVIITGDYFKLGNSYFWEPTSEPYPKRQNLVYLSTQVKKLNIPFIQGKQVVISKQDVSGKEIAGAQLKVTDKNGKEVDSWTSEAGKSHTIKVTNGDYTLTEITAPEGYEKAESIKFTVKDGKVTINGKEASKVVMIDKELKQDVVISKQDVSGKEIAGAQLKVTDKNGKEVDSWTSEAGKSHTIKVTNGDYTLTEITAPEGYEKAESIKFTVKDGKVTINGKEVSKVVMIDQYDNQDIRNNSNSNSSSKDKDNNQGIRNNSNSNSSSKDKDNNVVSKFSGILPQTGNKRSILLIIIGVVLLFVVVTIMILYRRKIQS